MIKMFHTFHRWCVENGLNADQFEITIAPSDAMVASRFEAAWHKEMSALTLRPALDQIPTHGSMYGVRFRYKRPEEVRPFGNSGAARG